LKKRKRRRESLTDISFLKIIPSNKIPIKRTIFKMLLSKNDWYRNSDDIENNLMTKVKNLNQKEIL
jgi:hypothetical protein